MKVRYTATALREIEEILSYLAARNPAAAAAVAARVEQVVTWIADFPRIGYAIEKDVRLLPLGRYPFLIFYTIRSDEVLVRNVRHHAQSRPSFGET
jgi:toxin ParE1/3/4